MSRRGPGQRVRYCPQFVPNFNPINNWCPHGCSMRPGKLNRPSDHSMRPEQLRIESYDSGIFPEFERYLNRMINTRSPGGPEFASSDSDYPHPNHNSNTSPDGPEFASSDSDYPHPNHNSNTSPDGPEFASSDPDYPHPNHNSNTESPGGPEFASSDSDYPHPNHNPNPSPDGPEFASSDSDYPHPNHNPNTESPGGPEFASSDSDYPHPNHNTNTKSPGGPEFASSDSDHPHPNHNSNTKSPDGPEFASSDCPHPNQNTNTKSSGGPSRTFHNINGVCVKQDNRNIHRNIENVVTYIEGDYTVNNNAESTLKGVCVGAVLTGPPAIYAGYTSAQVEGYKCHRTQLQPALPGNNALAIYLSDFSVDQLPPLVLTFMILFEVVRGVFAYFRHW